MNYWSTTFILSAVIFFFIHTVVLASDNKNCPGVNSPEVTAIKFQLFAAYQTGYDGYAIPCELKCFNKKDCKNQCQTREALRMLNAKLEELTQGNNQIQCPAHTIGCIEQCSEAGVPCLAACGREQPIAGN